MSQVAPGVTIPLKGDATGFVDAVGQVTKELGHLENELGKVSHSMDDGDKSSKKFGKGIGELDDGLKRAKRAMDGFGGSSKVTANAQAEIGKTLSGLAPQVRGAAGVFNDFSSAMGASNTQTVRLAKGVSSLSQVLGTALSGGTPWMIGLTAAVGVLSQVYKGFQDMKTAASEAAEKSKIAAEEVQKQIDAMKGQAEQAKKTLAAFRRGLTLDQLDRDEQLAGLRSERKNNLQDLPGGEDRFKSIGRQMAVGVEIPKFEKETFEKIKELNEKIKALTDAIEAEETLAVERDARDFDEGVQTALTDSVNAKLADEESKKKKAREDEKEREKMRGAPLASMEDAFVFAGLVDPETITFFGEFSEVIDATVEEMESWNEIIEDSEEIVLSFVDELSAEEIKELNAAFLDAKDEIIDLRSPLEKFAAAMENASISAGDLVHAIASGNAGSAGAEVGGIVGGAIDVAMGGDGSIGAALGSILGGVLGNALDELVAILEITTPLFDSLAIFISALQPVLLVLEELLLEIGLQFIALTPLLLILARVVASVLLIFVRLIQTWTPFVNILISAITGIAQVFEFLTAGLIFLDQAFFQPLANGARWIYNGFVDIVNQIINWVRSLPGVPEDFGVMLERMPETVNDVASDFAKSMDDLRKINEDEARDRDRDRRQSDFNTELSNLPSGFKSAWSFFASADSFSPEMRMMGGGVGSASGGGGPAAAAVKAARDAAAPVTINIGTWRSNGIGSEDIKALKRMAQSGGSGAFTSSISRRAAEDEVG